MKKGNPYLINVIVIYLSLSFFLHKFILIKKGKSKAVVRMECRVKALWKENKSCHLLDGLNIAPVLKLRNRFTLQAGNTDTPSRMAAQSNKLQFCSKQGGFE